MCSTDSVTWWHLGVSITDRASTRINVTSHQHRPLTYTSIGVAHRHSADIVKYIHPNLEEVSSRLEVRGTSARTNLGTCLVSPSNSTPSHCHSSIALIFFKKLVFALSRDHAQPKRMFYYRCSALHNKHISSLVSPCHAGSTYHIYRPASPRRLTPTFGSAHDGNGRGRTSLCRRCESTA